MPTACWRADQEAAAGCCGRNPRSQSQSRLTHRSALTARIARRLPTKKSRHGRNCGESAVLAPARGRARGRERTRGRNCRSASAPRRASAWARSLRPRFRTARSLRELARPSTCQATTPVHAVSLLGAVAAAAQVCGRGTKLVRARRAPVAPHAAPTAHATRVAIEMCSGTALASMHDTRAARAPGQKRRGTQAGKARKQG